MLNCGRAGHRAADCWQDKDKGDRGKHGKGISGKGKKGKKGGYKGKKPRDANCLEADDQWAKEDEYDASMLDLGAFTSEPGRVPRPSVSLWRAMNLDTGAAMSVVPRHWKGNEVGSPSAVRYRTASGAILHDEGRIRIGARTEVGGRANLMARRAGVHKPLISAAATTRAISR